MATHSVPHRRRVEIQGLDNYEENPDLRMGHFQALNYRRR